MDATRRAAQIASQLQAAADAHFVYETNELGGVYDAQWSDWYAAYLLAHDWSANFTRTWTCDELAATLRDLNTAQRANAPDVTWVAYYAARFAAMP
jgi:hypothetical protein